jgi:thiosulfate/3-mercaptopyruvate sulfurtransferase
MGPLVSSDWLAAQVADAELRIVDVRWYLDPNRKGIEEYRAGHIPGASFLDVDEDLAAPGGGRGRPLGRHPWPPPEQVARVMGRAGIGARTRVVAYDDQAGAMAARLWFLLRVHGHADVAVLDGGIVKWRAEGRALETSTPSVAPALFEARLEPGRVLAKAEVARASRGGQLILDARAAPRYRGESEPVDPRAGHVPGARNAPYSGNLTDGPAPVFLDRATLRRRYVALGASGATEPIVYCGSGVSACHNLLALELAGLRGRLYAGSWSEWSSDPALPVETG